MKYTTCEICGHEQYCFLQFCAEDQKDNFLIKNAVCTDCLKTVYKTMINEHQINENPFIKQYG